MCCKVHALVLSALQHCQALAAPAIAELRHLRGHGVPPQVRPECFAGCAHVAVDHHHKICGGRRVEATGYPLQTIPLSSAIISSTAHRCKFAAAVS